MGLHEGWTVRIARSRDLLRGCAGLRPGRVAVAVVGLAAVVICTGCERKGATPATQPQQAAQSAGAFVPPAPDLSDVPAGMRRNIQKALAMVRKQPTRATVVRELGCMYLVYGHADAAVACMRQLTRLRPEDAAAWYDLGLALFEAREHAQAAKAFEKSLELDDAYPMVYLRLARLYAKRRPARAESLLRKLLKLKPNEPAALMLLARVLAAQDRPKAALEQVDRLLRLVPDCGPAHALAAELYRKLGDEAQAREHAARADGKPVPQPMDFRQLAMMRTGLHQPTLLRDADLLIARRQFDQAERLLRWAEEIGTHLEQVYTEWGKLRLAQGKLADARGFFARALKYQPDHVPAASMLATTLLALGKPQEARPLVERLLKRAPEDAGLMALMARIRLATGQTQEAIRLLEQAHARAPQDETIVRALTDLLIRSGRFDEARTLIEQELRRDPGHTEMRLMLGAVLEAQGKPEQAEREWLRVLETAPASLEAYLTLTDSYLDQRRYQDAIRLLERGLKQAGEALELRNALAWLLATVPDASLRQPKRALTLAQELCEQAGSDNIAFLDTLAAAQAANGQFDEAVATQQRVVELARAAGTDDRTLNAYRQRLALYRARRPYVLGTAASATPASAPATSPASAPASAPSPR